MRIIAAACVLALCLGCSEQIGKYGNHAQAESTELVQDAVFVLFETYPPAFTRLALMLETEDDFGVRLVESLRLHGYAVAEYYKPAKRKDGKAEVPDGLPFAYLIDHTGVDKEIRLTLHVGEESLSRLYEVKIVDEEVKYFAKGFWSRREGVKSRE